MKKLVLFLFTLVFTWGVSAKIVIVSDLDDTIRQAHVLNVADAIRRVVVGVKPFIGLKHIYTDLINHSSDQVEIQYLSASKEWFYDGPGWVELHGYPAGEVHQRPSGSKISGIEFKRSFLRNLCEQNSAEETTFLLFGDSGENDPTVYREFHNTVCAYQKSFIFIRDIRAEAVFSGEKVNSFETHFVNEFTLLKDKVISPFLSEDSKEYLTKNKFSVPKYVVHDYQDNFVENICELNSRYECLKESKKLWTTYFSNF